MTITQRLYLVFSFFSCALIALAVAALLIVSGFQSRYYYLQSNTLPSIIEVSQMVEGSNKLIIWMYRHQTSLNPARKTEVEGKISEQINELKLINREYLKNDISNEEDRKLTEKAFEIIEQFQKSLPVFLEASRKNDSSITLAQLQGKNGVGEAARQLITVSQEQMQLNVGIGQRYQAENTKIYKLTFWSMIAGAGIAIFILGLFAVRAITSIRRSLNGMSSTMAEASSRLDLTLRADDSRKDEIGMTAKAYNHLMEKVSATLQSVNQSSQSVSTASAQISAGNEDLSSRTEEQAASLEQTAASMAELSETVRQTAENTSTASTLSQNALNISDKSSDKVKTMLMTMSDIKISSAKITDIISIIEGISFQTNILALNAAVEAARAGEQGRGFAVVAGEVRSLAQRSSSSAREIRQLIESSMLFVEAGVNQAEDVGKNMGTMNDAIRQVSDLVNEIAAAAHEQELGIGQVHQAVNQMDDVTQQNAALVEEASAASRSLMEQATSLNELVATFVLEDANPAAAGSILRPHIRAEAPVRTLAKNTSVNDKDNWKSF